MHAIIADKARPAAIPEDEQLATGKAGGQLKKTMSQESSDEIIKSEENKKAKSLSDIAFASKFVGQMSRTRVPSEDEVQPEVSQKYCFSLYFFQKKRLFLIFYSFYKVWCKM